jgi:hypothetical protein
MEPGAATNDPRPVTPLMKTQPDPPADLIQRAVVDDLAQRFGTDRVMATPVAHKFPPSTAANAPM